MTRDPATEARLNLVLDGLARERERNARLGLAGERLRDELRQLGDDYLTLADLVSAHQCPQDARTATNSPGPVSGDTPTSHDPRKAR